MSTPALAIVTGHISAVRAHTRMVLRGHRHTSFVAEITTPGGTFDVPVTDPDGLLDADVELVIRRLEPSHQPTGEHT